MRCRHYQDGFSLLEVLITIALITVSVVAALTYSSAMDRAGNLTRNISTKNRVLSGVRDFAAMPATLRASMRASKPDGTPVNPELLACVGGNPANNCQNGQSSPFTMFAPLIARDAAGNVLGIKAISAPQGSTTPVRIDSFGASCSVASPSCPFLIFTSMRAKCGPALLPVGAPAPTAAEMVPATTCTIAEVIEVTYSIQLDPSITSSDPSFASFVTAVSGSVTVPVIAISGNAPQ